MKSNLLHIFLIAVISCLALALSVQAGTDGQPSDAQAGRIQNEVQQEAYKMLYAEKGIKVLTAVVQFSQKIVEVNGRESHVVEGRFTDTVTNTVMNFKFDAMGRIGPLLENGKKYVVVMRESKGEVIREGHIIAMLAAKD